MAESPHTKRGRVACVDEDLAGWWPPWWGPLLLSLVFSTRPAAMGVVAGRGGGLLLLFTSILYPVSGV